MTIDSALEAKGWLVHDIHHINIHAGPGIAVREFRLPGHGFADCLLYVDGKATQQDMCTRCWRTVSVVIDAEITEDVRAALEEFETSLEDLGTPTD